MTVLVGVCGLFRSYLPQVYGDVMSTLLTISTHKELSQATNLDKLIRTIPSVRGPRPPSPSHSQHADRELFDHPYSMRKRTYTEPSAPSRPLSRPGWKFPTPTQLAQLRPFSNLPDSKMDAYVTVEPRVRLYTAPTMTGRKSPQKPVSPPATEAEPKRDRRPGSFKRSFRRRNAIKVSSLAEGSLKSSSALCLLSGQADSTSVATLHHSAVPVEDVEDDASPAPALATPIIVLHASSTERDLSQAPGQLTPRSTSRSMSRSSSRSTSHTASRSASRSASDYSH